MTSFVPPSFARRRGYIDVAIEATKLRRITTILPGLDDECIIVNTHTDGQNMFEENGAVAAVELQPGGLTTCPTTPRSVERCNTSRSASGGISAVVARTR